MMQMRRRTEGYVAPRRGVPWIILGVAVLVFTGCDVQGEVPEPGTLTIQFNNALVFPSGKAAAYVTRRGLPFNDPSGLLAMSIIDLGVNENEVIQVEGFDPVNGLTGEPWVGEPGWLLYDLYVVVESAEDNVSFDKPGEYANGYPSSLAINGNTEIEFFIPDDLREFQ